VSVEIESCVVTNAVGVMGAFHVSLIV
jgi:hypothetical protein